MIREAKIQKYLKMIDECEARLKDRERSRWTAKQKARAILDGETKADFFQILYKLSVLDRMRRWVKTYGSIPYSFRRMLKEPFSEW